LENFHGAKKNWVWWIAASDSKDCHTRDTGLTVGHCIGDRRNPSGCDSGFRAGTFDKETCEDSGGEVMNEEELRVIIAEYLPQRALKQRGQILYSGIEMLQPGDFYFVGFNPAADGTNVPLDEISLNRQNWSAYTCQCWMDRGECKLASCHNTGQAKHQRNVQHIMKQLELAPQTTFATNLMFVESRNISEIKKESRSGLLNCCWQVHKKLLAIIRPKYIVCLGNGETDSSFSSFRERAFGIKGEKLSVEKIGRYFAFKSFVGKFDLGEGVPLQATVIGVLHPSRWKCPAGLHDFVFDAPPV
jgi:hypothetical protein